MNDEHQHNDQFLKDFTKGKNPFKTPDNYFDNLSDKLAVDVFEESLPNQPGYQTPDQYFDNFKVTKSKSKIISLLPYISTAAVILLGFFIFNNSNSLTIDKLSNEEIIDYLSSQDVFETDDIINNTLINTNNITFASLDNVEMNIEQLDMELNEYDMLEEY